MDKKRRVVITGLGVVAANGIGVADFWNSIKAGKTGVSKISLLDASQLPAKFAAEVKGFDPKKYLDEKTIAQNARFSQFSFVAAQEAARDAELKPGSYDTEKLGVSLGTSMGGLEFGFDQHAIFLKEGVFGLDTFVTSKLATSAATRAISLAFHAQGPYATISSSCVASTNAIGYGLNAIRNNRADMMITGGVETPIAPSIVAGFYMGRILAMQDDGPASIPRPFDAKRTGTVLGEGAAILVLEELTHALSRKAKIYAELIGYGEANDAYHIVIPDPEGTQSIRAVKMALTDADVSPDEVNYISAHGTATQRNDVAETNIIKKVFGKRAYKIPISATKSMTGHLLGGSGAIQSLICALGIKNNVIAPTINYEFPDPECDLDYVPHQPREEKIDIAVLNSFGFGGFNAVLVFKKY